MHIPSVECKKTPNSLLKISKMHVTSKEKGKQNIPTGNNLLNKFSTYCIYMSLSTSTLTQLLINVIEWLKLDSWFDKIIYQPMSEYFWLNVSCYSFSKGDLRGKFQTILPAIYSLIQMKKVITN